MEKYIEYGEVSTRLIYRGSFNPIQTCTNLGTFFLKFPELLAVFKLGQPAISYMNQFNHGAVQVIIQLVHRLHQIPGSKI